jgi:hypothetical protein
LFLTAALSFKKGFSTRTLSEFGREPLLLVLKFQLNPGHPLLSGAGRLGGDDPCYQHLCGWTLVSELRFAGS